MILSLDRDYNATLISCAQAMNLLVYPVNKISLHCSRYTAKLSSTLSIKYPSIVKDIRQKNRLPCQSNIPLLLRIYGRKSLTFFLGLGRIWNSELIIRWKYASVLTSWYDLRSTPPPCKFAYQPHPRTFPPF